MSDDIHWLSAAELSTAYREQTLSPVEVAEFLLGRIDALDAGINSFCLIDADRTMAMAEASERRWREGEPLSPLDGVPVGVKDLLITKDWPTLRGSLTVDKNQTWDADAPTVARLREAGAVLIGKTTTPEFGWKGSCDSPLTGVTRNPWDRNTTPGGSSGGSCAAIAAGFCPLALGTDGGGSIRIPAAFTGTFGLKPSFGRVPAYPLSPFGTVAHVGPQTRTVEDAALLMNVISRPDARDWYAAAYDRRDFTDGLEAGIKGVRIAFSPRLGFAPQIDPEVEAAVEKAVETFRALGATVERTDPPMGEATRIFKTTWWGAAGHFLGSLPPEKRAQLDPGLRRMVEAGQAMSKQEIMQAALDRATLGSAFRQFMANYDFLVTPATATPAFSINQPVSPWEDDGNAWMRWTPFTYPFNLTQNPAAAITCGFTKAGLPIAIQIVGRMHDDWAVLRAAKAYETANPLHTHHPREYA